MSKSRDREEFAALLTAEGVPLDVCRAVLRLAATHQRLAEAECNGDWPYNQASDEGSPDAARCFRCHDLMPRIALAGRICPDCAGHRLPDGPGVATATCGTCGGRSVGVLVCKACRAEEAITAALAPYRVTPVFSGDPRGATVKLQVPSGRTNDWGQTGICVP